MAPKISTLELDNKPGKALPSADIKDIKQEYELWDRAHKSMKESPPPEGREYLKHAMKLLNLLQGVAELHPIAKGKQSIPGRRFLRRIFLPQRPPMVATVVSFKAILLFEEDRRENDARVTAVFLAQTDMMRVLLESVRVPSLFSSF